LSRISVALWAYPTLPPQKNPTINEQRTNRRNVVDGKLCPLSMCCCVVNANAAQEG